MKTFKTLLLAGAGLLLAGAANAQVAAPTVAPSGLKNGTFLTPNGPNNTAPNTSRSGREYGESSYVQQLGEGEYASVRQASYVGQESTADIKQTALATKSDAYQDQGGNGATYGGSNHAYIYQNGEHGIASQRQMGFNNTANARQLSGKDNWAYQNQQGDGHNAEVSQNGDQNFSNQVQTGMNQQSRVRQENVLNWSTTEQRGSSNTALVYQQ